MRFGALRRIYHMAILNLPSNGKRLIYNLEEFGLPEIPYLAAQNLPFTSTGLPMHSHRERMEINHILKGERIYRVSGKDYHLRGNQVFITWPHEMHGSGNYLHGRGLHFWMQAIIPRPGAPFLCYDAFRARPLLDALWAMPRRQFKAVSGMRDIFAHMLDICRRGPSELSGIELSALLTQWFLLLTRASASEWEDAITPDIAKTLEMMSRTPNLNLTIRELAETACLSESRFKGKFREQMGVPPGEYLLRRRAEMAADLLVKGGMSLTEIALELGFSSGQHFSSTFKKFFGVSPHAWLKKQGEEGYRNPTGAGGGETSDDDMRPWVDDSGQLHGYVTRSHKGVHPSEG